VEKSLKRGAVRSLQIASAPGTLRHGPPPCQRNVIRSFYTVRQTSNILILNSLSLQISLSSLNMVGPITTRGDRVHFQDRKKMSELIDNVARILATPMPRRKAMKLFGGALAAAAFAVSGARPASAAACKNGQVTCGSGPKAPCCKSGCCYGPGGNNCCSGGYLLPNGSCMKQKPSSGSYSNC
jgi:hypothetical protein